MIPLKLQLKNFLSYGADIQTIDFSTYPLICLSGKNGHGKSALLDAITWALWGQARKVSGNAKADQGLLRLGQTQMMVALDFEFNGQKYRVRREFAVTYGKPYATLDFGLLNDGEQFIPLTDKTISLTQAKIEHTLNLSYDSFTNSAFLRQGQANEFSKKSPKDRKEILATILGLNQYETVRKLALEKMRQASAEKVSRQTMQDAMTLELQKKEGFALHLTTAEQKLQESATAFVTFNQQKQLLDRTKKQIHEDQKNYQIIVFKQTEIERQENDLQQQLRTTFGEWRSVHKQLLTLPDTKALEKEKQQILGVINEHQSKFQKSLELKEQYLKFKEEAQLVAQKIQQEQATTLNTKKIALERLALEKQTAEKNIIELARTQEKQLLEQKQCAAELTTLTERLKKQAAIQHSYAALEKQFERRKEHYQKFVEQGRWITSELENLEQKKQLAITDEDPSCPLCEQNLSAARKRFLKSKFVEEEATLRHRLERITKVVKNLKAILIEQHATYQETKKLLEQLTMDARKHEELKATLLKIESVLQELVQQHNIVQAQSKALAIAYTTEQKKLAELIEQDAASLEKHPAYQELIVKIKTIEHAGKSIAYNQQEHQKATQNLAVIEQTIAKSAQILEQAAQQTQRAKTIAELCITLKQIKHHKKELVDAALVYATLKARETQLAQQEQELMLSEKNLTKNKEELLQEKARLETQLASLATLEKDHQEQSKQMHALSETLYDYQAIAAATGKDGIQALLIEDAIPEIEHEANYLLSRLTNNQAHIFIESLRDLKKGGTKETLDIKISDTSGIRPYELFSGGEAFRIDFALRIAISKLLARRAGTSLQTLIIDEGFGSQDEEGLGLIMDALYKVQEDFAKIIIVSHLASMKDQFPVHFIVEKGPQGSSITLLEQG